MKLGYMFYPKDFRSSDKVFEMTLEERGLYREIIDRAMTDDNKVQYQINTWSRMYNTPADKLGAIIARLIEMGVITMKRGVINVPSCEKRLAKVRAGSKGGRRTKGEVRKPTGSRDTFNDPKWKTDINYAECGFVGKAKWHWKSANKMYYFDEEDKRALNTIERKMKAMSRTIGVDATDEQLAVTFKSIFITKLPEFWRDKSLTSIAKNMNSIIAESKK